MAESALERILNVRRAATNNNRANLIQQLASGYEEERKRREEELQREVDAHNRGAEILNAQRQRDQELIPKELAADYTTQTVRDLVMPTRVSPTTTGVSASDAFRNSQNKQALEDSVNQILGNAVTTDEGKRQQLYNTFDKAINTNPQTPSTYSYSTVMDYGRAQNRNEARANSMVNNAILSDAQRKQREKEAEETRIKSNPAYQQAQKYQERIEQEQIDKERKELESKRQTKEPVKQWATGGSKVTLQPFENNMLNYDERIDAALAELDQRQSALDESIMQRRLYPYKQYLYVDDFKENSRFKGADDDYTARRINGQGLYENGAKENKLTETAYDYLDQLTTDEKGIYNYLYNTQGKNAADEFLSVIKGELDKRATASAMEKAYHFGDNSFIKAMLGTGASIVGSPTKSIGAVGATVDKILGNGVNPYAIYNRPSNVISAFRSGQDERLREDVSKAVAWMGDSDASKNVQDKIVGGASLFNSAMLAGLDSAWNLLVAKGIVGGIGGMGFSEASAILNNPLSTPEALAQANKVIKATTELSTIIMGAGAVPDAIRDAKERGLSDDQAFTLGIIAGIAEYGTEHWSLENLFNTDWTPKSIRQLLTKGVIQGGFEASEEGFGSIINDVADILVAQDKSDWQTRINEYVKQGNSKQKAFEKVFLEKTGDTLKDMTAGFLSTGGTVTGEVTQAALYDASINGIHNKVQSYDRKNGTQLGRNIEDIIRTTSGQDESQWANGLADLVNAISPVYNGNAVNRARDYLREAVNNPATKSEDALAYTGLADYLQEHRKEISDIAKNKKSGANIEVEVEGPQEAQETAQNAEETPAVTETTAEIPQAATARAANAERQIAAPQTVQTAQETAQEENAVQTDQNTAVENADQNVPTTAQDTRSGRNILLDALGLSEESTDADAAKAAYDQVRQSTGVSVRRTGLIQSVVQKQVDALNDMRNSGQYTPEQIQQATETAKAIDTQLRAYVNPENTQRRINALNAAMKRAGVKANIVVDPGVGANYETGQMDRGSYREADGTIHLNPYMDTQEAFYGVIAHEVFHKAADGSARNELIDDVLNARQHILDNYYDEKGRGITRASRSRIGNLSMGDYVASYADLIKNRFGLSDEGRAAIQNRMNANPGLTEAEAMQQLCDENEEAFWSWFGTDKSGGNARDYMREEVAAHFMETLGSQQGEEILRALLRDNRTALQKFIDAVRKLLGMPDRDIGDRQVYENLINSYERLIAEESGLEAKTLKGTPNEKTGTKPENGQTLTTQEIQTRVDQEEQLSPYDETKASREMDAKFYQNAYNAAQKNGTMTAEEQKMWDSLKEVRTAVKNKLDEVQNKANLPADIMGNTYFGNASYSGSEENTSVCPRTVTVDSLTDMVAEDLGRPLTVEESVFIAQEVFNFTDLPQCLYCYVAMDRIAKRALLGDYIDKRNRVYSDLDSGMTVDEALANFKESEESGGKKWSADKQRRFNMWVNKYKTGKARVTLSDLASEASVDRAMQNPDLVAEVKDAMKWAQSASWAKKKVGFAAYDGHILRWNQKRIDDLNSMFGLRMYSFSDYSPAYLLENMQMVTDAAVRGLKMLAYTKELDFVRVFAGTGMNINISVFGMDGENGTVHEDAMQGASWSESQKLRDQYDNVGVTFVATNDDQVSWALNQDWIDVVIPFHMVKTGAKVAQVFGWNNYTPESSDQKTASTKKGVKEIFPNQHQNSKELYEKALNEAGLKPRFERWFDNPNYMKLVNETRKSAQDTPAVRPVFDQNALKAAMESIDSMVRRGGYNAPIGGSLDVQAEIAEEIAEKVASGVAEGLQIRNGIVQDKTTDTSRQSREVTTEQDEEYLKAVEANDMDKAQQMVDEAARNAGYTIKVYHGTPQETISASRGRVSEQDYQNLATDYEDKLFPFVVFKGDGRLTGIYTATDKGIAKTFSYNFSDTGTVYDLYAKADNPFRFDAEGNGWSNISPNAVEGLGITKNGKITLDDVAKAAKEQGYDAVIVDNVRETGSGDAESPVTTDVIVFNPEQVKSADPVTYDDNGNIIPLSERFNDQDDDVRFSREVTEEDFDYDNLISKDPINIVTLGSDNGQDLDTRANIVNAALDNVRKQDNPRNTKDDVYVYNKDSDSDILVSKTGLDHGLRRGFQKKAQITAHIGDLLKNALLINRHYARGQSTPGGIYLAVAQDDRNDYICRIVTNDNMLDTYEVLSVIDKKNQPRITAAVSGETPSADADSNAIIADESKSVKTDSEKNMSVEELLEIARKQFADALPKSVLDHFEMERPHSTISDSIMYSREMKELDDEYMDAVDSGDEETAQRMVDEAARAAGAMTLSNGKLKPYYHGTGEKFTVFDINKARDGMQGYGFYFTPMKHFAEGYGDASKYYLMTDRIATRDDHNITPEQVVEIREAYNLPVGEDGLEKARDWVAKSNDMDIIKRLESAITRNTDAEPEEFLQKFRDVFGYDGMRQAYETVLWDNRLMKSADPVTYDNDGNIIPPSERFDPNKTDIRWSREVGAENDSRIIEERDKYNLLKAQFTAKTPFGDARAINKSALNEIVKRYTDLFGDYVPEEDIKQYIRGLYEIAQRPIRENGETAEARYKELGNYAEDVARKLLDASSYANVLKSSIGDEDTLNALNTLYDTLNLRRSDDQTGYYYLIPDMIAAAGSKEAWNEIRKSLNGMRLQGFNTQAEAEKSGRKSISELFTKLSSDGGAYNSMFEDSKTSTDFEKISQVATQYSLAREALHDAYETVRTENRAENEAEVLQLANDLLYAWGSKAKPTRMAKVEQEAQERIDAANQRTEEARQRGERRVQEEKAKRAKDKQNTQKREAAMEERFDVAYERLRQQYERRQQKAEKKYEKFVEKIRQRDIRTATKELNGQIAKRLKKLNQWLEKPQKENGKHIPQKLRPVVAKVLESVLSGTGDIKLSNSKTMTADRMRQIQQEELLQTRHFVDDLVQGLHGIRAADGKNSVVTEMFLARLDEMVKELNDLRDQIKPIETSEQGNELTTGEQALSTETRTQDEESAEAYYQYLLTVKNMLDMTLKTLRGENRMIINGKAMDLQTVMEPLKEDIDGRKSLPTATEHRKLFNMLNDRLRNMKFSGLSGDLLFRLLGDNWHDTVMHSFREGQNRQAQHEAQFADMMKELTEGYDFTNAGYNGEFVKLKKPDAETSSAYLADSEGSRNRNDDSNTFNATRAQIMQLYALWQRPDARRHLENGGACFTNERGQDFQKNTYKVTPELFEEWTSVLTDEEKQIADGIVKFLSEECSEWGNDVSMYVYGYRMYDEDHYFPMDVADYSLKRSNTNVEREPSPLNPSFSHATTKSVKPLSLTNIFDVANEHVRKMSIYNAYAAACNDLDRIVSDQDMNQLLLEKFGNGALDAIKEFIQTTGGMKLRTAEESQALNWRALANFRMNNYKRQAVSWNLSTAVKQGISIVRAANVIAPQYLVEGVVVPGTEQYKEIRDKMRSMSGVAYIKSLGYSDTGFGKTIQQLYDPNALNDSGIIRGALSTNKGGRGLIRAYDRFTDAGMWLAAKADEWTWVNLWNAASKEVQDQNPNASQEELDRLTTQRFNDIIGETQVVDTALDTAPIMRSKMLQVFLPFMNEPTKSLGNLILAADRIKTSGGGKQFAKVLTTTAIANMILEPIITTLFSMWRDEKDDSDKFWESFMEKMFGIKEDGSTNYKSIISSNFFGGLWQYPFIQGVYDAISNAMQNYDNTSIDNAAIIDTAKAAMALFDNAGKSPSERMKTQNRLWRDFIEQMAADIGIPAKTIRRQLSATARSVMNAVGANELKWEYQKLSYNLENSNARSQKGFYDILAKTYMDGDLDAYNKMMSELNEIVTDKSTLIDEKSLRQAIEKRGAEIKPGTDIWNLDVQARFRLDQPVKGWKVENFITGAYVQAQRAGIDESVADDCLLNMPDAYEYTDEDGDKIKMNPADYLQYAADVGQLSYRTLSEMSSGTNAKQWAALNADQKVVAIRDVYKYCKAKFKKDYNEDYDINHQGKWMTALYDENATPDQIAKAALEQGAAYDKQLKRGKNKGE